MKTLISILALGAMINVAQADGFAPWTTPHVTDTPATATATAVAAPGFAPWRDSRRVMDAPDATQLGDDSLRHGFRPWS